MRRRRDVIPFYLLFVGSTSVGSELDAIDAKPTHCLIMKGGLMLGQDKETWNTKILFLSLLTHISTRRWSVWAIPESSQIQLPEAERMGQAEGRENPFSDLDAALWLLRPKHTDLLAISRVPVTQLPQCLCTHGSLSIMLFPRHPHGWQPYQLWVIFSIVSSLIPQFKNCNPLTIVLVFFPCLIFLHSTYHLLDKLCIFFWLFVVSPLTF